jgi:hypothetical protein
MALQAQKDASRGQIQLIAFRVPGFQNGFIAKNGACGAGDALVQGKVRSNGKEGRFDDIAGHGFMIIARGGDPTVALSQADRDYWSSLGGRVVRLGDGIADSGGQYGQLMDEYGCDVIVKRPDFNIFGACRTAYELPALLAELRGQLA